MSSWQQLFHKIHKIYLLPSKNWGVYIMLVEQSIKRFDFPHSVFRLCALTVAYYGATLRDPSAHDHKKVLAMWLWKWNGTAQTDNVIYTCNNYSFTAYYVCAFPFQPESARGGYAFDHTSDRLQYGSMSPTAMSFKLTGTFQFLLYS
jgi:hypothetical protein